MTEHETERADWLERVVMSRAWWWLLGFIFGMIAGGWVMILRLR